MTRAWANSRDAGRLFGTAARLHPQVRGCIEALGVGDGFPRWVADADIIRASPDDGVPLWGLLMGGRELAVRLAVISWAQGVPAGEANRELDHWQPFLSVEQVRKRSTGIIDRDEKFELRNSIDFLLDAAARSVPTETNPLEVMYPPSEAQLRLRAKYEDYEEVYDSSEFWGSPTGQTILPPRVPRHTIDGRLLTQGWHLLAPGDVLGWMIAQKILGSAKGVASKIGRNHLGLKKGFRAADRARYYTKLNEQNRELATLTLQRSVLWALVDLDIVPATVTDVGLPIQTLLVGRTNDRACCVAIHGGDLYLWYRRRDGWDREPFTAEPLDPARFSMTILGDDTVQVRGLSTKGFKPLTIADISLHTFPENPAQFPTRAWKKRTEHEPKYYLPLALTGDA